VLIDDNDHKWFGTEFGVSEYFDNVWTTYLSQNAQANYIFTLSTDMSGNIWVGSLAGVLEIQNGNQTSLSTADGLVYNQVNAIAEDQQGNMWFGTQFGASKYNGTTMKTYSTANGLAANWVSCIVVDKQGLIWFGSNNKGVSVLKPALPVE
jgi:ligand-binding sensor domain-containing protein